jgi:hypothetical protein
MDPMQWQSSSHNRDIFEQLKAAEAELEQLNRQLSSFEAVVDTHLGSLLDQLSDLNDETSALEDELRQIREERLYGKDLMSYLAGAPTPARPPRLSELDPRGLSQRNAIHAKLHDSQAGMQVPDIKALYRKLARRFHPDLSRNAADRSVSNQQMAEINQAYAEGDVKKLMRLAGVTLPYGVELPSVEEVARQKGPISEPERAERRLKAIHQQIDNMGRLPIVKLSLDVKLAQRQGRNLLREMASELQYKVGRKLAERDYLQAQISASGALPDP